MSYATVYDDGAADWLDSQADEYARKQEELENIVEMDLKEAQALAYGMPITMIKSTDTLWAVIQWMKRWGKIQRTIPLAGGRMTTKQELVDCDDLGVFYLKTGWFTKDGRSAHTMTPDEFILERVEQEVRDGKAY